MRYTSAVVLSTLAVGQAAAHNARHASFHARRNAASKRDGADYGNVDWAKVSYDLSGVDWSSVFATSTPAAAPAPSSSSAAYVAEAPEVKTTPVPTSAKATPTAESSKEAVKTTEEAPKKTEESGLDKIGDILEGIFDGVEDWIKEKGISKIGVNSETDNGKMWLGNSSPWKATFTNDGSGDGLVTCWNDNGFTGMTINVNQPELTFKLPVGGSQDVSFAANVPAACSIFYSNTELGMFGGCDNTWWEATFGNTGAFDVSRNVNMNGNSIHSKGSKCTSDMDTCVFKCKDSSAASCETGYDLFNCGADSGGGGGYDSVMQGTGGGCSMGQDGETVQVTFSD